MTSKIISQTAYWYGYEHAITNKPKPVSEKYQSDIDAGYADGKRDLHSQLLEALQIGTVQ